MAGIRAAKRYAKGLMQFANEVGQTDLVNQEMTDLKNSIRGSRELANFLSSPVLDNKRKNQIGKELFKGFSPTTQNFISLVINQGRGNILMQITRQFNHLYNLQNNIGIAEITSAVQLDDSLVQQIVHSAIQKIGGNATYQIENKIDPEIIGGFVLRIGDKQIDSSVKSRLNRLKKEFGKNEYIPGF